MADIFFILFVLVIVFVSIAASSSAALKQHKPTVSDDGHRIPKKMDLTCEGEYGHEHSKAESQPRYIVHEEPEDGYVVLNGIKRRIEDCRNL